MSRTSPLPVLPQNPGDVLRGFDRWPTWMWANADVVGFTRWLRAFNMTRPEEERVGFYGLGVYALWDSLRSVLDYLEEHQPDYVGTAQEAFRCFESYAEDPQRYALSTRFVPEGCEAEVVRLLAKLFSSASVTSASTCAERLNAQQNAHSARGAEAYYRAMMRGGTDSWKMRDQHMVATLDRLMAHHGSEAKAVVREHNPISGTLGGQTCPKPGW